jgi:hypothetical protein
MGGVAGVDIFQRFAGGRRSLLRRRGCLLDIDLLMGRGLVDW